jgi:hypothetical protein
MREDLFQFLSVCLKADEESDFAPMYNFILLNKENKLLSGGELKYGSVVSEIQDLNDSYTADEYEESIYGVAPPAVRVSRSNPMTIVEVLYPDTLADLHKFIIAQYLQSNVKFKKCKNCRSYFAVLGNSKLEYCNRRIAGSKKTCRQVGSMLIYQTKKLENPINKAYTKAYKTHNARIRYGIMTHKEFEAWSIEARERRDKCLAGLLDFEDFMDWLRI